MICTGTSDRMLDALADATNDQVRTIHQLKGRMEGKAQGGWLLIDYGDVIVHLFAPERRDYYRLEELWNKGKILLHLL